MSRGFVIPLDMSVSIITSDLHYGITSETKILALKREMLRHAPSLIIIAGDTGESAQNFDRCLELFSDVKCPVGVIAGNHDLYNTDGSHHTEELWKKILPGIVKKYGFVLMEEEDITISDTAFIGSMAWYDYSSRPPGLSDLSDDFFYENKGRFVSDGNYIDWERKDLDFAKELLEALKRRLAGAQADPDIKRIVVITHVPMFKEQMIHYRTDNPYADAYFGNLSMGMELERFSKVTDVISGHTHRGVDRKIGNIRTRVVPSDYRRPGFITLEV